MCMSIRKICIGLFVFPIPPKNIIYNINSNISGKKKWNSDTDEVKNVKNKIQAVLWAMKKSHAYDVHHDILYYVQ